MSITLYVDSKSAVAPRKACAEKLAEELDRAEKLIEIASGIIADCRKFAELNEDVFESTADKWFACEPFEKSHEVDELKYESREMFKLACVLRHKVEWNKLQLERFEFVQSEEFEKWYDGEHRYDYERA